MISFKIGASSVSETDMMLYPFNKIEVLAKVQQGKISSDQTVLMSGGKFSIRAAQEEDVLCHSVFQTWIDSTERVNFSKKLDLLYFFLPFSWI